MHIQEDNEDVLKFSTRHINEIYIAEDDKGRIAEVDYALKNINQPIGVSDFKISSAIPEELKSKLPTIEDIEREFDDESE